MGFLSSLFGTGSYPLSPKEQAKAKARGRKAHGKQVKASTKANNKRGVSDERGYGAKGGGWFS
jgi:hypothetical protein